MKPLTERVRTSPQLPIGQPLGAGLDGDRVGTVRGVPDDVLARLARRIPVVVLSGPSRGDSYDHVTVGNAEAMAELTRQVLAQTGDRPPAFLAGPDDSPDGAGRSSLITSADIAATGADYVALGHHHVLADVSAGGVTAFYSGAPTGYPGGQALVVELCPDSGVTATPVTVTLPEECAHPASGPPVR